MKSKIPASRRPKTFMTEPPVHALPTLKELRTWLPHYEIQPVVEGPRHCYPSEQTALARPVVIELISEPEDVQIYTALLERLRGRARVVHPSLEAVLDLGKLPSGHILLITERAEGRPLSSVIESREIRPRMAFPLALQLCEALQLLHDQGILHGHVSPASVIITHDQRLKLLGAGLGVDEATGQSSWHLPFQGSQSDDVHALGVTLHWMFARCAPGADGRLSRDLPPAFATVLHRCLAGDVSRPLTTASAISEALTQALRQEQERTGGSSIFNPPTTRSIVRPGAMAAANRTAGSIQKPTEAASPPAPAVAAGGAVPQRPQPLARAGQQPMQGFIQRMDAFVWRAFSTGLHLLISGVSIGSVILLVLFKDKIVIEHSEPEKNASTLPARSEGAVSSSAAGSVLGGLPPVPVLAGEMSSVESPKSPLTLPATLTDPTTEEASVGDVGGTSSAPDADEVRRQYVGAVQDAANHALSTLRMDDLPHLQRELQLLQNGGEVPETDAPDEPAILRSLRMRYRQAIAESRTPGPASGP